MITETSGLARLSVLEKYPTAWVYIPKGNYPIGINGGNTWTIMKEAGCLPVLENALGPTSLMGEGPAWSMAAAALGLDNKQPMPLKLVAPATVQKNRGSSHTKYNNPCLLKAGDDEPIFVIRAQDESASGIIQMWLVANPNISAEKRADALDCQREMREWPKKKKAD